MGWLEPVRPGDTLSYFSQVVDKKTSASRPQWGLVMMNNGARNQQGELAFRFDGVVFWERRTGSLAPGQSGPGQPAPA